MNKIVYCQVPLTEEMLKDLKRITKTGTTIAALTDAVEYRIMHAQEGKVK